MTYWQPRILTKFAKLDDSQELVFPLAEYAFELDQDLYVPSAPMAGAHGEIDLVGDDAATKGPIMARFSCVAYETVPKTVEVTIDAMMDKVHRYGRGKLWSLGLASNGEEELRWTRARATAMPHISWQQGMVLSKQASIGFRCDPFWYGEDTIGVQAQGTLTVAVQPTVGDTFTIGSKTFTFVAEVDANANGEVGIGANLAGAKVNIVAAINGGDGFNTSHVLVTAAAFSGNNCVVTAINGGEAGNDIAFSETFTSGSNVMDGSGFLGGTTAGGSVYDPASPFSITNPGNAPIFDVTITIDGSYTDPVIRNTTNGYRLQSSGTGTKIRYDAGRPAVETWDGSEWVNDYANFQRNVGQVHLMRLEPGSNSFTVSGATGDLIISAYPAWH